MISVSTFPQTFSFPHLSSLPARESDHVQTELLPELGKTAKDSLIEPLMKRAQSVVDAIPIPGAKVGIMAALYVIKEIFVGIL